MKLNRIRTRDVYVAALVAFVGLVGFEGVRMATGHDPALAAATAAPTVAPDQGDGWRHHDDGEPLPENVPQPQSRLS